MCQVQQVWLEPFLDVEVHVFSFILGLRNQNMELLDFAAFLIRCYNMYSNRQSCEDLLTNERGVEWGVKRGVGGVTGLICWRQQLFPRRCLELAHYLLVQQSGACFPASLQHSTVCDPPWRDVLEVLRHGAKTAPARPCVSAVALRTHGVA